MAHSVKSLRGHASILTIFLGTKKPFGFSVLGMSLYTGQNRDQFKILNKVRLNDDFVSEAS